MKHILAMLLALLGASGALAQIYVKVVPEKKTFLSGEAMYMRLTITNNSGVPVELKSREYSSWLDIHVEHSTAGAELPQSKFALFPPLKVPAGMSVSRKIDLRHFYDLSREGNYHVQAVVKMPNQKDMFASQKSLFAVRTGTPMWSQTVAIPSSAKRCTFSICTIAVRGIQKLYVQTKDPDTGVAYNAVCIAERYSMIYQIIGCICSICKAILCTCFHILFVELHSGDHAREKGKASFYSVNGIKGKFLVFLHIFVVSKRNSLHCSQH